MSGYPATTSSSVQPYAPSGVQMTSSTNYDTFPKIDYTSPLNYGTTKTTFTTTTHNNTYSSNNTPFTTTNYSSLDRQQPTSLYRSHIYEHNKNQNNDRLYEPLRNIVTHPEMTTNHQIYNEHAVQSSKVSHQYRHLNDNDYRRIKDQTYISEKPLKPTDHYEKVQGKHFYILDATQKIGQPISENQFRSRQIEKNNSQKIVYEEETSPVKKKEAQKIELKQEKIGQKSSKDKKTKSRQAKYNMYSCLDQPFERVTKYGCSAFKCPANQCIAKTQQYDWLN